MGFQSTRPVWGATNSAKMGDASVTISIHAPRVGRDAQADQAGGRILISIHAPRVGRDFNRRVYADVQRFQYTRPVWGATGKMRTRAKTRRNFNPRAPCGARQGIKEKYGKTSLFQSTRPVWGATLAGAQPVFVDVISIHAPRVGRDETGGADGGAESDFNPRAPCGARLRYRCSFSFVLDFNPRAPCGARLSVSWSIPRLPVNFNPRAPCGARQLRRVDAAVLEGISIHAPRVGRDPPHSSRPG